MMTAGKTGKSAAAGKLPLSAAGLLITVYYDFLIRLQPWIGLMESFGLHVKKLRDKPS
jgi:hypothetical protein